MTECVCLYLFNCREATTRLCHRARNEYNQLGLPAKCTSLLIWTDCLVLFDTLSHFILKSISHSIIEDPNSFILSCSLALSFSYMSSHFHFHFHSQNGRYNQNEKWKKKSSDTGTKAHRNDKQKSLSYSVCLSVCHIWKWYSMYVPVCVCKN